MRIGLVVAGELDAVSGGYLYDRRLISFLRERGHAVEVVTLPVESYPRQLLANRRDLAERLAAVDVVVEDGLAGPSLLVANRRLDVPTVALCHMLRSRAAAGSGPLRRRLVATVEERFLRGVDAAIHNSGATRRGARELGCPPTDVIAPPGGDRFDPDVGNDEIRGRAEDGPLEACFLGNVIERKGPDVLVEGLARADVDWRLTVIGDETIEPKYASAVRRRVADRGLAGRVTVEGRLPDDAVANRLRNAHVLAVPSRYEPFGIVYLEGMSFGCVPLATTEGGAAEFVTDGASGLLVPPTPDAVANGIESLADHDRLASLGVGARRAYERQPTWDESLARVERFLAELVDGGRVGRGRDADGGERAADTDTDDGTESTPSVTEGETESTPSVTEAETESTPSVTDDGTETGGRS
ncbi:glycosyltransferase family 4 protein [Halovivax sp.]|uniref:glycosyltransferase family 4 protein n=1 Tax=Halovivax sp. TaxID=1935978 RepID=UPI0025B8F36C|nr:glycosyltransferase family 4 protein [Halovivax sp.]